MVSISGWSDRVVAVNDAIAVASDLENGDMFTLQIDRSLLDIDRIALPEITDAEFAALFPQERVAIAGLGKTRSPREFLVDRRDRVLIGKDVGKYLAGSSSDLLTFRVQATEPLVYELINRESSEINSRDLDCDKLPAGLLLQPGWERIIDELTRRNFESDRIFSLHETACHLDLCQPLDRLVSLAVLPDLVPYPHQVQVVKAVISKFKGRALLCDEVGLGKTIEAGLTLLEYLQRGLARRVLILAPPALTGQWQEELRRKFSLDFVINDEPRFKGWGKHDMTIGSLATAKLAQHSDVLCNLEFDLVIVDEAHHLRNRNTKAWQLVNSLKKRYILLLTATPMQNGLSDLYNLVTVLKPGYLKSYREFKADFVSSKNPAEPKNAQKLRQLLQQVMTRNKRSHTNLIMSKRHARTVELEFHEDELEFYRRVTALVRRGNFKLAKAGKPLVDAFTLQLLQLEAGSSVPATLPTLTKLCHRDLPESYLSELRSVIAFGEAISSKYDFYCAKAKVVIDILNSHPGKLIVFTRFQETQSFLKSYLSKRGVDAAMFHGGLKRLEKEAEIARFKDDDSCRVLLSSESGGEGRNLQFCRALINYDLPWNPMKIEQRIGRIHRLGQEKDVHIFNLSAAGTAESYVLSLLDKKINMFELVVGEVDMILGNLETEKDFEEILFEIWSESEDERQAAQRLEDFGKRLHQAKALYLQSRELDERVFGDALATL